MKVPPGVTNYCADRRSAKGRPLLHAEAYAATDLDLVRVVALWPDLPPHIRAAVLALLGAAR